MLFFTGSDWCGWCKKAKPEFERLVKENPTDVHLVAVNCDEKKDLAKKLGNDIKFYHPKVEYHKHFGTKVKKFE